MIPAVLSILAIFNPAGPRVDAYGDPLPAGVVARLGSVRWRCPDAPDHLIWSPDGKYLVGTHSGKSLTIWAYPAGTVTGRFELPELLPGYSGPFEYGPLEWTLTQNQVRWSPDSRRLLVYGGENRLLRIDVPTGRRELVDTGGHRGLAIALSVDGRRALLEVPGREQDGYRWAELFVLDLGRRTMLRRLWDRPVSSRPNIPMVLVPGEASLTEMSVDGRFAVAASTRSAGPGEITFRVFDLEAERSWPAAANVVSHLAITPDGQSFLSTSDDGLMRRWGFATPRWYRPGPITGPFAQTPVKWFAPRDFSPDGRTVVRVSEREPGRDRHLERSVTVFDVRTLRKVQEWSYRPGDEVLVPKGETTAFEREELSILPGKCAVAPDNRTLAVTSDDSPRIRFFDLNTGTELRPVGGHAAGVVALRRIGSKVISVGSDQVGRLWELPNPVVPRRGREVEVFDHWADHDLPAVPPSRNRLKIVYDPEWNRIEARDSDTEAVAWQRPVPSLANVPEKDRPKSLPVVVDGFWERLAVGVGDSVTVCDVRNGDTVAEVQVPGCWASAIEFGPHPDTLYVGYHDGQVLVWDLRPADLPRRTPTDAEFRQLWTELGGSPRAAARTRSGFLDDPAATLRWLDANLRPLPRPTGFEIDWWLAKLAHPKFAEREEATRQLVRHFDVAGRAVAEMLAATRSPEVEHRLRMIIDRQAGLGGDGAVVRLVRLVTILERMGASDANRLLLRIARGGGVPAERAADALVRIQEREKAAPVNQPQRAIAEAEPQVPGSRRR